MKTPKREMLETAYKMATETHIIIGKWKFSPYSSVRSRYSNARWEVGIDQGKLDEFWYLTSKGKWINIKD